MASFSHSEKHCLYKILDVSKESSPEEIRSSYRRLALQHHPDKLIKAGGISEAEATAQFQELVHAYEVLSDPKERAWYDSHRSQILFADQGSTGGSKSGGMPGGSVPDLFAFFSTAVYSGYSDAGKEFYKVNFDVFNSVYLNEIKFARTLGLSMDSVREAPIMGNLESPYSQVSAFYNYWLGFSTVMDFCWVDEYDVMAGPNRRMRRKMEDENKKVRKKAKREYNEQKEKVAELRETFSDVEEEEEEEEIDEIPETVEKLKRLNVEDEEEVEEKDVDETNDEYFMAEEDVKGSSED